MSETAAMLADVSARVLAPVPGDGRVPARALEPARRRPASGSSLALFVEGLSLAFGGVAALSDVSLSVAPGEIRAIIGPNGAGKSSLLNVVSGLYRPHAGTVCFGGARYTRVPTARLAHLGVARTFQNLALFKGLSVLDNVAAGLTFRSRAGLLAELVGTPGVRAERRDALARSAEALAFFHLSDHADRLAGTLPYGLQKRVELARAMVAHPHLLLLDEPMAGMTRADKQELSGYIRTLRDEYGTAVVLIEHDVGLVMGISDRVAVLDHGVKIADGAPADVARDQAVIDAYLGVAHDESQDDATQPGPQPRLRQGAA